MAFDQLGHQCDTSLGRNIREADESRMREIVQKYELAEIGVDGHQNPVFGIRMSEQRPIARIGTKLASFENIVPLFAYPSPVSPVSYRRCNRPWPGGVVPPRGPTPSSFKELSRLRHGYRDTKR